MKESGLQADEGDGRGGERSVAASFCQSDTTTDCDSVDDSMEIDNVDPIPRTEVALSCRPSLGRLAGKTG